MIVVVKNPSDFVGDVLGASETTTRGILASTLGKVLVIDEAYMLAGNSSASESSSPSDPYKTAVIDTLVAEVQSVPGDDRCVLLLGYKDQMEKMFQDVNPGLSRRFPMSSAFHFDDYTDDDLQKILDLKLEQAGFDATSEAKKVVRGCLSRARNRANFGNAGEVDILLDQAKLRHQQRLSSRQTRSIDILEPLDFDPNFDRGERAAMNCRKLFEGVVGCDDLIAQLEGYQRIARNVKKLGMDPREQIPFNFLFRGPPGKYHPAV
jgi:AAA lid domain